MADGIHVVTVVHNDRNTQQAKDLIDALDDHLTVPYSITIVDNSITNRGFARACNLGAQRSDEPIIGFLNPDLHVDGDFGPAILQALARADVEVAGERFGKPNNELKHWGIREFVCGAAFFVVRRWWDELGGFDERFVWSHEETDFIRRTEERGRHAVAVSLPVRHESPSDDSPADAAYKQKYFDRSARLYREKWGTHGR
jgi:GT2 family glycosyltransferase